jgi:histidyl-tRNA synthetase
VAVVGATDDQAARLRVAGELRAAGIAVRPDGSERKLGKQLEAASKAGARWAVIVGEEIARGEVALKDLESGEQRTVPVAEAIAAIGS